MRESDSKPGDEVAELRTTREELRRIAEECVSERLDEPQRVELAASLRKEIRKALGIPPQQHSVMPAQAFAILGLPWHSGYRLIRSGELKAGVRKRRYSITIETIATMLADWTHGQVEP